MARIAEIPYKKRNWARPVHDSLKRFFAIVLHRRAGKTTCVINHHLRAALNDEWEKRRLLNLRPTLTPVELDELIHPIGGRHYGHVMPTRVQAKLVAWDKLKHYAEVTGAVANESELLIKLPNGNKVQLFGADSPDALRGPAFSGLSFDEYSQQPPTIFSTVLSKGLADHLGYAMFLGTIQGHDHLWRTYQAAKNSSEWFSLWQDVEQSLATEEGITIQLLQQAMMDDRKMVADGLMSQAEFDQEWYLSAEAAIQGSYYGDILAALRQNGHVTDVPYDPSLPVDTDWDLGIDAMAVWFTQKTSWGQIRVIDYLEDVGNGMEFCIKAVAGQQPNPMNDPKISAANERRAGYMFGEHWGPHDIETREISSGKTRRALARAQGIHFRVTPKIDVADGITAVQATLKQCYFDEANCNAGIEALTHYRRTFNKRLNEFTAEPVHDWASHGSDAFRGFAVRYRSPQGRMTVPLTPTAAIAQRTHQKWTKEFERKGKPAETYF